MSEHAATGPIEIWAPDGLPDFRPGDDLAGALARVLQAAPQGLADGDIVVYDPNGHTSIGIGKTHHMNMDYSAWEGFEIDGHVDTVLSRGKVIVDENTYLGRKGDGRYLKRGLSQYLV